MGNKKFQDGAPWKGVKETPDATASLIWNLTYLVRDLAILASPYLPTTSERVAATLGSGAIAWSDLGVLKGIGLVQKPELLFARLEDVQIEEMRLRFSGTQKERREAADAAAPAGPSPAEIAAKFRATVDLRAAKIVEVKRHPDAEKLYVETIDLGTEQRTIVSGLVPHYKEEELLGRTVVLVANLKPALLRGMESQGMLLAASEGKTVEVLFVDHAGPGDRVLLGGGPSTESPVQIDIDAFFSMPITAESGRIVVGDAALECGGKPVVTARVSKGRVK
jgi:methionyl-tRNA synthetase